MSFTAPHIDYAGLSPVIALTAGICVVLLTGWLGEGRQRVAVSIVSLATLATAAGLCIWQWGEEKDLVAGALRLDHLALATALIAIASAAFVIPNGASQLVHGCLYLCIIRILRRESSDCRIPGAEPAVELIGG